MSRQILFTSYYRTEYIFKEISINKTLDNPAFCSFSTQPYILIFGRQSHIPLASLFKTLKMLYFHSQTLNWNFTKSISNPAVVLIFIQILQHNFILYLPNFFLQNLHFKIEIKKFFYCLILMQGLLYHIKRIY